MTAATAPNLAWQAESSRGQFSETFIVKDEDGDASELSFDLIPEGETYRVTAYETYRQSGGNYEVSWAWDFGTITSRSHARDYCSYILAGWIVRRSFAHCPSVRHADELL